MPQRRGRSAAMHSGASQRRKLVWATFQTFALSVPAGGASSNQDLLNRLEAAGVGIYGGTIMRTHLQLSIASPGTDTSPGINFGVLVHDKNDTANEPSTDLDADWMLLTQMSPGMKTGQNITVTTGTLLYGERWDLRSRRRLRELGDAYHLRIHNNGSVALTTTIFARTLIALP
jgi:hypothetical protein